MAKNSRKKNTRRKQNIPESNFDSNIRFIVSMPGKSSWHISTTQPAFKKLHTFTDLAGDYALEDYQAQFLMQREYLID